MRINSSSNFHEKVRKIFCEDPFFKNLSCYQEVAVLNLVEDYYDGRHHVDWYIEELNMVLELHGEQHYGIVNYGNKPFLEAKRQFEQIKKRDLNKKQALISSGYEFREISYKKKKSLDAKYLMDIIFNG